MQLIRIRSKDGNFRFEFAPTADISELVAKVRFTEASQCRSISYVLKILETTTNADPTTVAISNRPRGNETLVSTIKGNLQSLGLSCVIAVMLLQGVFAWSYNGSIPSTRQGAV